MKNRRFSALVCLVICGVVLPALSGCEERVIKDNSIRHQFESSIPQNGQVQVYGNGSDAGSNSGSNGRFIYDPTEPH